MLIRLGAAQALTVTEIRKNLTPAEQIHYVTGLVEGLAFARWLADNKDSSGMACIWDWYLGEDSQKRIAQQRAMFDKHPDQHVSTLVYAMIKKKCGD